MKKWLLLLTLAFPIFPVFAEPKDPDGIHVSISENDKGCHVLKGEFSIASSTSTVWGVLTDYDTMADFVSSIKSSRRVERKNDHEMVEQVMSGKAGFFRKRIHLLLDIQTQTPHKIIFHDVSRKSFKTYSGSWDILTFSEHLEVKYQLEAEPNFFSPDFITTNAFKKTVKSLLTEVQNEIMARMERQN